MINNGASIMETTIITFGTYDLLHYGHIKLFENIKKKYPNSKLIVGVSSDELNVQKKNRKPITTLSQRLYMVNSIKYVDDIFIEESLEKKAEYCDRYNAKILIMGDDHIGRFDDLITKSKSITNVIYLPRTPEVSSSEIISLIKTH